MAGWPETIRKPDFGTENHATNGAPLTRRLALRLEAAAALFLVTHRYIVDPDGAIGRSPRTAISLAGGLEWSIW